MDDDLPLLDRCIEGDREAFDELVLKHQKPLYSMLYRMVSDADDAADILQKTFVKAFIGIRGFERRSSFRTPAASATSNRVGCCMMRFDLVSARAQGPSGRSVESPWSPERTSSFRCSWRFAKIRSGCSLRTMWELARRWRHA